MAIKALSGGDKLESVLRDLAKKAKNSALLKVGFQDGSIYPDGQLVSTVAAYNEFGVPARNQPPRPFFRNMIAKNSIGWGILLGDYLVNNDFDAKISLSKLGENMINQLQDSIVELTDPPLSPVTIAKKGFDKPLIDTSHMLHSITKELE